MVTPKRCKVQIPDWIAVYGAIVSTALALLRLVAYRRDRYKLSFASRYLPSLGAYVIEARNVGRKPITITAAGITRIPTGYQRPDQGELRLARETFPSVWGRETARTSVCGGPMRHRMGSS